MKKVAILSLAAILATSCNAQEKNKNEKSPDIEQNKTEKSMNKEPKGTWEVHKEVDENGNIIRYDSIYSWSSSNDSKHFRKTDLDSIMGSFQSLFGSRFDDMGKEGFPRFFENDSIFMDQFFDDDFFNGDMHMQMPDMKEMQEQMMRMRNRFLQDRGLILAEPDSKSEKDTNNE